MSETKRAGLTPFDVDAVCGRIVLRGTWVAEDVELLKAEIARLRAAPEVAEPSGYALAEGPRGQRDIMFASHRLTAVARKWPDWTVRDLYFRTPSEPVSREAERAVAWIPESQLAKLRQAQEYGGAFGGYTAIVRSHEPSYVPPDVPFSAMEKHVALILRTPEPVTPLSEQEPT